MRLCLITLMMLSAISLEVGDALAAASEKNEPPLAAAWTNFKQGEYSQAEERAKNLLAMAISEQNLKLEYEALNVLLAVRYTQNNYSPELLDYEYRQAAIAEQLGEAILLAAALNNLGYDLLTTGQAPLGEIIPRLERANQIYADLEQHQGRWYTLMNLTWAYRQAGRLQQSRQAGERAVARAIAIADRHALIETKLNLAETLSLMGDAEQADQLVAEARAAAGNQQDRDRHVFEIYAAQHQLDAGDSALQSNILQRAIDALDSVEIFYAMLGRAVLADLYLKTGNEREAAELARAVIAARDNFVPREAIRRAERVLSTIANTH
jgi:tetratricopeptide (TPR) repeat protein